MHLYKKFLLSWQWVAEMLEHCARGKAAQLRLSPLPPLTAAGARTASATAAVVVLVIAAEAVVAVVAAAAAPKATETAIR